MRNPTILTFSRYFAPGYRAGGPIRTLVNLVEALGDQFDFRIVTSDRDHGDVSAYANVHADQWTSVGKAKVCYLSPRKRSIFHVARILRDVNPEILYLNSLFDPTFTTLPLVARRWMTSFPCSVVIAPRGECSTAALRLRRWKKQPYLTLASQLKLFKDVTWQASNETEASNILGALESVAGPSMKVVVAEDLAAFPRRDICSADLEARRLPEVAMGDSHRSSTRDLKACFLSRIVAMKNLDYLLRVLTKVKRPVFLSIYGPKEDKQYWSECERLMAQRNSWVTVQYCGSVKPEDVVETLSHHDLLILPSRGENFGHVILESLAAGTPVLTSDQTPWMDLADFGVGWALPLSDPVAFARVIDEVSTWDAEKRRFVRCNALTYASKRLENPLAVRANCELFTQAVARSPE